MTFLSPSWSFLCSVYLSYVERAWLRIMYAPKIKCRSDPGPCFHPNLKTDPEVRSSKKLEEQH